MVVCISSNRNITNTTSAADWGGYQWDISGLFGASPLTSPQYDKNNTITGIPVELFNRKMQACVCVTRLEASPRLSSRSEQQLHAAVQQ